MSEFWIVKRLAFTIILLHSVLSCSCLEPHNKEIDRLQLNHKRVPYVKIGELKKGILYIRGNKDLNGGTCVLPKDIVLDIRNGKIINGELIGCNTKLKCNDNAFNRVRISGTWLVPVIKSSYFEVSNYENSLKDICALQDPNIHNKIIIDKGNYFVSTTEWGTCVEISSNTEFVLNGNIKLIPNAYAGCKIIQLTGENIKVKGSGTIVGDKETHLGETGEWGMGINLSKASRVLISGLSVHDCWGDCIYIGSKSNNVVIEKCRLTNGRRQGISITSARNVVIRNCKILDVGGTEPEYAIDVEPNKRDTCDNIYIENVEAINSKGGFLVYGDAKESYIGNVSFKDCEITNCTHTPLRFEKCNRIIVNKVKIPNKRIITKQVNELKLKKLIKKMRE